MFERATRECAMSPRMVTFRFFKRTLAVANGQRVEQSLRGMLVRAVAGVDYRNFQMPSHKIRGAGRGVSHHETIRLHGIQVVGGVEQRFALFQAGCFRLEIHLSAPRREAAVPKLKRVRVEFSKNASATVFPRRVASFFRGCL